ncbi:MAG: homoserine kinase [Burkholderiales bacterium]|jgi:homoserine kinase type II
MSVFTTVTVEQASAWLRNYSLGSLVELEGILSGIENTNYFLTTSHGRYVLTLFEKLTPKELPFYLHLMAHLSNHGVPAPKPIANLDNELLGELNGKPAAIVTRLSGQPVMEPGLVHCARVGEQLADMHLSGQTFKLHLDNLRCARWWTAVAPEIYSFLDDGDRELLKSEIEFQSRISREGLPRGPVHADLFRDNVLFDGDIVGGVIDFYFACVDSLIYDVAITVNDWCSNPDATLDAGRADAMLEAYDSVRAFTDQERSVWPAMLRAAALRFWVSRLYDFHLPRAGELTHAHDPEPFRRLLITHRSHTASPLPA